MRGSALAIAAVTALLGCAAPAGASGAPPRQFYGVVSQSKLHRDDLARMAKGNVGTLRVTLSWSAVDPSPVFDYDWSAFDDTVAEAARRGIEVLPAVFTVPGWVSALERCEAGAECGITPPHTAAGLAAWRTFLGDAARRYGPGGVFWLLHPELPDEPIETWQIWNEENDPGFFAPAPDVGRYAALLSAASEAIRGVDASAEILLGGMCCYPLHGRDGGIRTTDFLRSLYEYPGIDADFDGIAIHPYAARLGGVRRQVESVVRLVGGALGDTEAGIWITEVGWASGGAHNRLNRGPRGQARRLAQAFRYFTRQRARLGIRAVLWYAWRDVPQAISPCLWCPDSGLFHAAALVPKPAWSSFVRFTGGR
ncbi:MAG: polysaccharide biosynthesis protein PslG [Solirubrobacterales bacterium]|jgi:hypothetical protein|nr:polysaccharide biosynthesis protein PslG [Solirubrobacterales bacterium]